MIVRHFLGWVRTASASERAEATRALARAWLYSDLTPDDFAATEGALLLLLDDPSSLVREAMAETFAHTPDAPPAIIRGLSCDQPSVALPVLEFSPLLIDADLVDTVAVSGADIQCAIARRAALPTPVCAAIAEVGCVAACLELIGNADAQLAQMSLDRIVERFGHLAAIREKLFDSHELPAKTRLMLVEKLSNSLANFVTGRNWLSVDRAEQIVVETCERSAINIAATSQSDDRRSLVRHLRETGDLNAGLILRALLSGNREFFEIALVELTGFTDQKVAAIVHDGRRASLTALLTRAGFPETTFAAFLAALEATSEIGFVETVNGATRLRRRMVERVLTSCEQDAATTESLMTLLRRFEMESAREEARVFCDELLAGDAIFQADSHHRIAA